MKIPSVNRRQTLLAALALALPGLFLYVALRSGPLARIPVTTASVQEASLRPVRFGIGTVEARRIHRIGPTLTGRLLRLLPEFHSVPVTLFAVYTSRQYMSSKLRTFIDFLSERLG